MLHLGKLGNRSVGAFVHCHLNHLCQVKRPAVGQSRDLLATTEPVGDDERIALCLTDSRQESALADCHRNVIMPRLEAE